MKRIIKAADSISDETKYGIGLFVDDELAGYLTSYDESRGISLARCNVDINKAKTYYKKASANRALAYYRHYNWINLVESGEIIKRYRHWKEGYLETTDDLTDDDIRKCKLEVVEI